MVEVIGHSMVRLSENPFLLKDSNFRQRRPTLLPRSGTSCPPFRTTRPVSFCATDHDFTSCVESTDLEYGPGIVQRLREKFSRLAKQSSSTATSRRFPSVDDLLDSTPTNSDDLISQTLPRMRTSKSALEPLASSSTTTGYSSEDSSGQSDSKVFPTINSRVNKPARFPTTSIEIRNSNAHQQTATQNVEELESTDAEAEVERPPIRSLREKFERHPRTEYNVRPVFSPRSTSAHTGVVARYDQPPTRPSNFNSTVQPERVVLRPAGRELQQRQSQSFIAPTSTLNPFKSRAHSPPSSTSSGIAEEPHQETSDDMESIQSQEDEYTLPMKTIENRDQQLGHFYRSNSVYQPPELKSPINSNNNNEQSDDSSDNDKTMKKKVGFTLPLDRPILRNNGRNVTFGAPGHTPIVEKTVALQDATAMVEVHRLLNKFNAKRTANEQSEDTKEDLQNRKYESTSVQSVAKLTAEKPPIPPATVSSYANNANVTKSSLTTTNSVPSSTTISQNGQPLPARRSLSAQYLESKKASETPKSRSGQSLEPMAELNVISENTLSVDATELDQEENTSISSLDSLDVVEEIADYEQETMFATDHGPVRHSLINLVLHEDIPDLLQAMAEDLHFVFEDYSSTRPQMNGIMQKRRSPSQKQTRVNNRICFATESPKVFTYLNETCALNEPKWIDGQHIPLRRLS
ncbi:hypothetical protein M3Y94_00850600 [Aphelenchoides besseyi]|nr:hypothetical protein M3Y94_00850600 [Aphelenchoides besseyi]